MCLLFIF
jgi:hypothetical protein